MLAFGLFRVAETATWVALLVWAFERGGATAAGIIAVGQLVPATLAAPLGSALTERLPRPQALRIGYLLQAGTNLATAIVLFAGAPFWVVTLAAAAAASAMTLSRPVHHALVPELSRSPEELTAANSASTAVEGVADFVGPVLAAGLLVAAGAAFVFVAMTLVGVASWLLSRGIRIVQIITGEEPTPYWADAVEGLRVVVRDPAAAAMTAIVAGQFVVLGLLEILAVVLAFDLLGTGPAGPGIITSGLGVGALVGAAAALGMVGRRRLGPALYLGMVVTAVPLALVAGSSSLALAVLLFVVIGAGNAAVDVAARTLLQRSVTPRVLARILGVQEALMMGGLALGAAIAPILVVVAGPRGAFVATAVLLPVIGLAFWTQIRRVDRMAPSGDAIRLLRSVSVFSFLPAQQLEPLAAVLQDLPPVAPGEVIIRQGDVGDRCYLVIDGTVAIERDGVEVARIGPGAILGEIALLRDIPRTATARATDTVTLAALDREPFLLAVTGSDRTYRAVDEVARQRHDDRDDDGAAALGAT